MKLMNETYQKCEHLLPCGYCNKKGAKCQQIINLSDVNSAEFKRGMRTAVMFVAEMLDLTEKIYRGMSSQDGVEKPDLLLARLCGEIEKKEKHESTRQT